MRKRSQVLNYKQKAGHMPCLHGGNMENIKANVFKNYINFRCGDDGLKIIEKTMEEFDLKRSEAIRFIIFQYEDKKNGRKKRKGKN